VADHKVCLVVMVAYLDSPSAIQNILEVLEVLMVLMGLSCLLLALMVDQQNSIHLSRHLCMHIHKFFPPWSLCLDLISTTISIGAVINHYYKMWVQFTSPHSLD
jgi:hypothetical protein